MEPTKHIVWSALGAITQQLLLVIGSMVIGIAIFWIFFSVLKSGSVDFRVVSSMLIFVPIILAINTLFLPLYFLSLLAIRLLDTRSVIFYAGFGVLTAVISTFLNQDFNVRFKLEEWELLVATIIAGAAGGYFYGYFDVKYLKSVKLNEAN